MKHLFAYLITAVFATYTILMLVYRSKDLAARVTLHAPSVWRIQYRGRDSYVRLGNTITDEDIRREIARMQ